MTRKRLVKEFEKLGYECLQNDKYGFQFKKEIPQYKFTQNIEILYKSSGNHIAMSCDDHIYKDDRGIWSNCVCGTNIKETKLMLKALKIIDREYKKNAERTEE